MSNITIYKTKTTTLKDLLDHFEDLEEENLDFVVKFLETQLGLKHIADMGKLDWDGDILSLVSLTSDIKKEGGKVRLASAIFVLKQVEKLYNLQGVEGTIFLPPTFYKLKQMVTLIEKGMNSMASLYECKFPRPISHKNWVFLKRDILDILKAKGLEWTLGEDSLLSPRLSVGVCVWFRRNIGPVSNYEHLVRGSSSKEIWDTLESWFNTSELISGRKTYLRGQLNEIKLDSVGAIEEFVNKYTLLIEELTRIKGTESQNELVEIIRRGALSSSSMQSNASRIEDAGVQTVEHLSKVFSKIYVSVHGSKVFNKEKPKNSKANVRRVESGNAEPKIHTNYLNKKDYGKLSNKLSKAELETFHKTRNFTKKIKNILKESDGDKGVEEGQVQEVVTTSPGTDPNNRKRTVHDIKANNQGPNKKSRPNPQPALKKGKAGKNKKAKKALATAKTRRVIQEDSDSSSSVSMTINSNQKASGTNPKLHTCMNVQKNSDSSSSVSMTINSNQKASGTNPKLQTCMNVQKNSAK